MESIINSFQSINPVTQALMATCFTWLITALGAATIFIFAEVNRKLLDGLMGFAVGVMMAVAAGAMLYVVVEELIPESQLERNTYIATTGTLVGFAIMMLLDVALG